MTRFASGSYLVKQYTILQSAGLGGTTFDALATTNLPAGFAASLGYTSNDVLLDLTAALGAGSGLSGNQQNVANGMNNYFNGGGTLPSNFVPIFGLTGGNLSSALDQLSGEAATGGQQASFQLMSNFLGLMLDTGTGTQAVAVVAAVAPWAMRPSNRRASRRRPMPRPSRNRRPSRALRSAGASGAPASAVPAISTATPAVGSHDITARTYGFAGGLDYHVSPDTLLGFALSGGGTKWDLSSGLGGGSSDAFQAGVYGKTRSGPAYLSAAFAFANHWMKTDRYAYGSDHLTASFDAQDYAGRLEGGYRFARRRLAASRPMPRCRRRASTPRAIARPT